MSANANAPAPPGSSNRTNISTHSSSSNYPQLSKDGTQIVYSWLPHSTALGASSTVALRVRNASLAGLIGPRRAGNAPVAPLDDEKKCNEGEASSNDNLECRVEASIYGMGLPLQAAPISTKYSSLIPYNGDDNSAAMTTLMYSHHPDFARGKAWSAATFDTLISLPVRWRDLTRDACLTLNVFCDGDFGDHGNGDRHDANGSDISEQSASKVWGTTLPLFDRRGRLRSGLYKLKLHPNVMADGGMSYQSKGSDGADNEIPVETFLEGGATPGISDSGHTKYSHSVWFDGRKLDDEDIDDPKWKASLILHGLNRLESSGPSSGANAPGTRSTIPASQQTRPVPWLDALTRERCLDVLNEQEGDDSFYGESGSAPTALLRKYGVSTPTSSHHDTPYLIIELPTPPIPILHEEPLYPAETSTNLRGTTGSISASELIKFHSQFRPEEDKGGEGNSNDGLTVQISPLAMGMLQSPEQPQSFLYPLVQTLDHEPPLTDENEDNPTQQKYRILAHDLIRGLVDPGLKPDRVQRGRLERIVGSPSYHLSTEEKDLLWRFRFSLVDNRRALTKFLLAVDWTVESEVVQAAELLEQWRKRSPIEVTDALKLLGRNVAFQTSLVRLSCILGSVWSLFIICSALLPLWLNVPFFIYALGEILCH